LGGYPGPINEIAYYESTFNGKVWYQLLYGGYPARGDAERAASKLPENIGKAGPWIRKIAKVQEVIRRKAVQ
jgi:septal ring-binding cell division protein DamX